MTRARQAPRTTTVARRTTTSRLRRGLTTSVAIGAVAGTGAFASLSQAATSHVHEFQTATGNVQCGITDLKSFGKPNALICSESKGFLTLHSTGKTKLVNPHLPFAPLGGEPPSTLAAGSKWSSRSFSCVVQRTTVTCKNGQGHGFLAAGGTYKTF
jgi:hypothetical protein